MLDAGRLGLIRRFAAIAIALDSATALRQTNATGPGAPKTGLEARRSVYHACAALADTPAVEPLRSAATA